MMAVWVVVGVLGMGAAAAAYAARAGRRALVLVPEGKIALGKMSQAMAFGARVLELGERIRSISHD